MKFSREICSSIHPPVYPASIVSTNPWGHPATHQASATNHHLTPGVKTVQQNGQAPDGSLGGATSSCSLSDPYPSMSSESQRFVDSISLMGFPRSRVARSVEKHGKDGKQVSDGINL